MSNYPPGMSKRDFIRAGIDQPHHHEHEWEPNESDYPLFEDGAAVFSESCRYAEGRWGEGWACEETRWLRCDVERIIKVREGEPNIAYLASEENPGENWGYIERIYEDALVGIEIESARFEELEILDIDPPNDYGDGFVRVRYGDYIVEYQQ